MTKLERTTLIKGLYAAACTMEESALRAFMQVVKPRQRLGKCSVCSKPIQTIYPLTGRCILHRKGRSYMRELLTCLVFGLVSLTCFAGQPQQARTVNLVWDATPYTDGLSNYVFYIRGSTNVADPLPWPIVLSVPGTTNATITVTNSLQFFYCTATNITSSPTNFWCESNPSNTVRWCVTPSGSLSIAP